MTRVLSVASECVPLVKTGGLADVTGALPAALAPYGVDMRVLLPAYPAVLAALENGREVMAEDGLFGGRGTVRAGRASGLQVFALDAPHLFDRGGNPYMAANGQDWPDNPERFAALGWMAARLAVEGAEGWMPQVLHLHDWQAGLAAVYLRQMRSARRVGTVFTVHNIAFSGSVPADRLAALRLDNTDYNLEGFEFYGRISTLKAGLVFSDRITTVSPTYARELMTPAFGMGLDGVMRARAAHVTGILNGVDEAVWNPAADPVIPSYRGPKGKARSRAALIETMALDPDASGPLCVVVSRLSAQKGLDLLLEALPALLDRGGQLALLGSGDPMLEAAFLTAAEHPRVAVRIGYDEALSHRMIAGGDAILVPSRFEPCGLTQLYGLRYGTVPLVALTGGLADTVIHANSAALAVGVATGIQFHPITAAALAEALADLCRLYADRPTWERIRKRAMAHPVGWQGSAAAYAALFADVS